MKDYVLYKLIFIDCNYLGEEEYRPYNDYFDAENKEEALKTAKEEIIGEGKNVVEAILYDEEDRTEIAKYSKGKWNC